ncbi:hypothetical protein FRC11_005308 [Ceratobasidium sp. 423]|nr:hypothetical protein FRC11_005308 [Ceratobasidium sp. 423]
MDEVQEIPGEGELAAMKEAMPARDQIPEIDDEPQVESSDEREPVHIMSDDDTTVIGQDELASVKGSPVVVPVIKHDFERPISPPATPPIAAADIKVPTVDVVEPLQANSGSDAPAIVNVVPDESFVLRDPSARNSTIEEAAKAVEEHAKFVEDAASPTDSTIESSKPENDSPVSEFVVVSDEEPTGKAPAPVESSNEVVGEAESELPAVAGPTTTEVAVPEEPALTKPIEPEQVPTIVVEEPKPDVPVPVIEDSKPAEELKTAVEEPKVVEEPKETEAPKATEPEVVKTPKVIEEPKVVEEPKIVEEPKAEESKVEEPVVEEPKIAEEPKVVEEPEPVEVLKPEGSPKAAFPSLAKSAREEPVTPAPPRSLGRPRVMRRATGSGSAIAGVTTSPAPATVAVAPAVDDRTSVRAQTARRNTSPPPMPLPPQRQNSKGTSPQRQGSARGSQNPQVPQAAVMSPSVLSRRATIDSNGSPGSPPTGRRAASPPPTRPPAEEFTTDQSTRRNVPFPPSVEGQPVASTAAVKPRSRPRTSTSGSAKAPTAPNTLLATLTSKVTFPGGTNSSSTTDSNPTSPNPTSPSPASPNRSDSFASAVSNRSSIYSFSDMSDMDMSTSDLDFAGRESHRMVLNGARFDSMSSIASSDGGMSGNEEEKREKRAKRRAKARTQALKKQKRSKRN